MKKSRHELVTSPPVTSTSLNWMSLPRLKFYATQRGKRATTEMLAVTTNPAQWREGLTTVLTERDSAIWLLVKREADVTVVGFGREEDQLSTVSLGVVTFDQIGTML